MDKFREKITIDYDGWDIDNPYNRYKRNTSKLKKLFKRKARKILKRELNKELIKNGI